MGIEGTCDERFAAVRERFAANLEEGRDVGASVAITLDGELVVDLWGGTATDDTGAEVAWGRDTIVNVWSTTKTMTNLCALLLADQGELDLHAPVAAVWPEFAANGKGRIELAHVLSHSSGLSGWAEPMTTEDLYDWEKATGVLARQAPWWVPGTAIGYHAYTQGYLVGEVVRRVTGQTVGEFFAKELAGPLGADFHIGTPPECDERVVHVISPPTLAMPADIDLASIMVRTLGNPPAQAEPANTVPWRRAELPAVGGHGNARSVATVHAMVACAGEAGGVRLLSPAGCERIFEEQIRGQDMVIPLVVRHGLGFGIDSPEISLGPNPRIAFWGGWGGSLAVVDLDARMSFGYVMNRMGEGTVGDDRSRGLLDLAYAALAER